MAKKQSGKLSDTFETLKPYIDRALTDPEFRDDVKDALEAARELYGPISKSNGDLSATAKRVASDKKTQKQLKRALEDLQRAGSTLKGKKKKKKRARKMVLLAGVIVGALYNPWTGPQTREWLLDRIAGDDELQPLVDTDLADAVAEAEAEAADAAEAVADEVDA
jgi:Ribonuclease G/E